MSYDGMLMVSFASETSQLKALILTDIVNIDTPDLINLEATNVKCDLHTFFKSKQWIS
jgi:hypothetical protein